MKNTFKFLFISILTSYFLLLVSANYVSAQELQSDLPQASQSSQVNKIDYDLAYPGILPDSSLYFLKAGRDRIVSFFISNPLKKADFEVTQADKRVLASLFLAQKGKYILARDTLSKAENYFEDAIVRTQQAKSQGMNTLEMAHKLSVSNSKHQEVLLEIKRLLNKTENSKWEKEARRLKELENKAKLINK